MAQCACVIASAAYNFRVVSVHSQDRVKCDTEQLDGIAKRDHVHRPCDVNAAGRRYLISLGLSPEQNCLRLGWVEKQPVLKEPASDVFNTL